MFGRQFVDEAAGQHAGPAAIDLAVGDERYVAALARARDADIGEAALLLEALGAGLIERAAGREHFLLPAGQEDHRPFEALGGVKREDLHLILRALALGIVHHQFDVLEKGGEGVERAHRAHEFLEVVEPGLRLRGFVGLQHVCVAALLEDNLEQARMFGGDGLGAPALHVEDEAAQACFRGAFDLVATDLHVDGAGEIRVQFARGDMHLLDRGVADAALGLVHHALESQVVGFGTDQAKIGHCVADLGALEEARTADDAIGRAGDDESFFEGAHLPRGADEDGAGVIAPVLAAP